MILHEKLAKNALSAAGWRGRAYSFHLWACGERRKGSDARAARQGQEAAPEAKRPVLRLRLGNNQLAWGVLKTISLSCSWVMRAARRKTRAHR
jgi:hypothetical protein